MLLYEMKIKIGLLKGLTTSLSNWNQWCRCWNTPMPRSTCFIKNSTQTILLFVSYWIRCEHEISTNNVWLLDGTLRTYFVHIQTKRNASKGLHYLAGRRCIKPIKLKCQSQIWMWSTVKQTIRVHFGITFNFLFSIHYYYGKLNGKVNQSRRINNSFDCERDEIPYRSFSIQLPKWSTTLRSHNCCLPCVSIRGGSRLSSTNLWCSIEGSCFIHRSLFTLLFCHYGSLKH